MQHQKCLWYIEVIVIGKCRGYMVFPNKGKHDRFGKIEPKVRHLQLRFPSTRACHEIGQFLLNGPLAMELLCTSLTARSFNLGAGSEDLLALADGGLA